MDSLAIQLSTNPLLYIEYFLATVGALGALLFLVGLGGGVPFFFNYSEDQHHMDHARGRTVWGIYICMVALGLWEVVRIIIGSAPFSYLWLVLLLLTPLWIPWLYTLFKSKPNGGH